MMECQAVLPQNVSRRRSVKWLLLMALAASALLVDWRHWFPTSLEDVEPRSTMLAKKPSTPAPPNPSGKPALAAVEAEVVAAAAAALRRRHLMKDASWAALMGSLGTVLSMMFAALGAGYGMAKAALGVVSLVNLAPSAMFRGMAPVVMAELLAIYGFISGLNILSGFDIDRYNSFSGYLDFGAGLTVGLSCLVSGLSIGAIADANLKAYGRFIRRAENAAESRSKAKESPAKGGLAAAGGANYGTDAGHEKKPELSPEEERQAASRIFTAMILMLIFAEGLGLYGMIVGLLMHSAAGQEVPHHILQPPLVASLPSHCGSTLGGIFGGLGVAIAVGGALAGASYGISRAGVGAAHLGVRCAERLLRGTTPVIMSELLAIYGFVVGLIIALGIDSERYTAFSGYLDFSAGCTVGFGCMASGFAIGTLGDACNRVYSKEARIFVAMVLMLIFAEALGLYSLIVSLSIHSVGVAGLC